MTSPPASTLRRQGRHALVGLCWPLRLGPAAGGDPAPATPFRRLAVLHLCSTAGDAVVTVALAGSVFVSVSLTAARGRTALALVCTLLPFLVVGPFLGQIVDSTPGGRRVMLCLASLGRAFGCLLMASWFHNVLFFPAAFLTLVCSKAYLISRAAIVPSMVEHPSDLVAANSKLAVGSAVSSLTAGALGALIFRLAGTVDLLHLDAALLVFCAILAVRLRPVRRLGSPLAPAGASAARRDRDPDGWSAPAGLSPAGPALTGPVPAALSWARLSRAGPGPTGRGPAPAATGSADLGPADSPGRAAPRLPPGGLGLVAVAMASMRASAGLMTVLVVFAFRRGDAPLYWYGLVGVASVASNLGGAVLAPVVRGRWREEWIVPGCAVAIGLSALAVLQLHARRDRPAALLLVVAVTLLAAVAKLAFDSLVQHETRTGRRGRAFARLEALFQLSWVVAALVPVGLVLPLGAGFAVVAATTLGAVAVTMRGLRLAARGTLPSWWPGVVAAPRPGWGAPVVAGPAADAGRSAAGGAGLPRPLAPTAASRASRVGWAPAWSERPDPPAPSSAR